MIINFYKIQKSVKPRGNKLIRIWLIKNKWLALKTNKKVREKDLK